MSYQHYSQINTSSISPILGHAFICLTIRSWCGQFSSKYSRTFQNKRGPASNRFIISNSIRNLNCLFCVFIYQRCTLMITMVIKAGDCLIANFDRVKSVSDHSVTIL